MTQSTRRHAAVLVILIGASPLTSAETAEQFCGLGPPPGTPTFESYAARRDAQFLANGYVLVCDRDLVRLRSDRDAQPLSKAIRSVRFKLTNLEATPFRSLQLLGAVPDHFSDGQAFSLRRVFSDPSTGRTYTAYEWNMEATGGWVRWLSEAGRTTVMGMEARAVNLRTTSGKSYASVNWVQGGRHFEVSVYSNQELLQHASPVSIADLASSVARAAAVR